MGWMIAALVTSIVILGGVWYYTQTDDIRRKSGPVSAREKGETAQSGKSKVSLKDIWDIEDIRDSVVFLKGRRYSAVISVGAIDFRMMSEEEQNGVENALIQAALSLSFDVQLYAASDYIDVQNAINDIAQNAPASNNTRLMTYAEQAVNFLNNMMRSRTVYVRRNYIIVSYDGPVEKAYEELNRRCSVVIAGLQRAKVPARRLSSSEILNMLYSRLNRGSSAKPADSANAGAFELYVDGASRTIL